MSFALSNSYENGITKYKVLAKRSGKSPFSEYLGFQSTGLEFLKCQILARTCAGVEKQNSKKGFEKNKHVCILEGVLGFRIFLPIQPEYLKVVGPPGQTRKIQSSSKLRQFRK